MLGFGCRYEAKERMKKADFHEWIGAGERLADLTVSSEGATRQKAVDALDGLSGRDLVNAETDIKARINKPQRNKIVSNHRQRRWLEEAPLKGAIKSLIRPS